MCDCLKLVVLDIDDTLFLEQDYVRSGFRSVDAMLFERIGVIGFFEVAWGLFEAGVRGDIFDQTVKTLGLIREVEIPELVHLYRTHRPEISLLDDAKQFVEACVGYVNLAVVTDGPPASQNAKIEALGLKKYMNHFVVTGEHGPDWHKPSAKAFLHLQDTLKTSPHDCIYYADNPKKDFIGPRELGWHTTRVIRNGGLHSNEQSAGEADRTVADFANELEHLLLEKRSISWS